MRKRKLCLLLKFHPLFNLCQKFVESYGNKAENGNAQHGPVELEYLTGIDYQVTESCICRKEFADDDTNEGKSDADLHDTDDDRKISGQDYFGQNVLLCAAEGVYELDFFFFRTEEGSIKCENCTEHCNGDSGNNNRFDIVAEADDENRSKGRFWQTVEYDQIGLQDFGKGFIPPEQDGNQNTKQDNEGKADKGFCQRDTCMVEQTAVFGKLNGGTQHTGRTAEQKGVQYTDVGKQFPKPDKSNQDGGLYYTDTNQGPAPF